MAFNIADLKYNVELITESGAVYPLDDVLISMQWGEEINELAQRATLTVMNIAVNNTWVMDIAKINCIIRIFSNKTLMFDGTIWDWGYTSAEEKELTITAYDRLIRLQQSKDFYYFQKGMTTKALIEKICGDWGVPVSYTWKESITHEKKTFSGQTISDMIFSLLEEVKQKSGEKYIAYLRDNQLQITDYGTNSDVYLFDTSATISTRDHLTINNLVTKVKIIGKEDKQGRAPVEAILNGDTRYGVLQEIVRRDANKKPAEAQDEAKAILKTRGKPEETIQVEAPDLPFLRKGDKVQMAAGNLLGLFYLEGVTHMATDKKMTMTLTRVKQL